MRKAISLLCLALLLTCPKSPALELEQLEKAAAEGNVHAQCDLGSMYAQGKGVRKDEAKAAKWFQKAAAQGDADAQASLGFIYVEGKCVPKDEAKGAEWMQKSALQGNVFAQAALGAMYAEGRGVPKDDVRAYAWLNLAAAKNAAEAAKARDMLEKRMTTEQKAEAQKLSSELLAKMPKK